MDFYPNRFYVYSHSVNGVVLYIGKGSQHRAFEFSRRSKKWHRTFDGVAKVQVNFLFWSDDEKEALDFEKLKIQEVRPIANCFGNPNYKMPKKQKLDISKSHAGKTLSQLTKSRMSKAANSKKKKVRNKDTGEIYESIKAASLVLGVPYENVKRCLQKGFSHTGGHRIEYA